MTIVLPRIITKRIETVYIVLTDRGDMTEWLEYLTYKMARRRGKGYKVSGTISTEDSRLKHNSISHALNENELDVLVKIHTIRMLTKENL